MRDSKGRFQQGHPHNQTHGLTGTRIYRIWDGIKRRCLNPKMTGYNQYGGAGITVCDRWLVFANFLDDMGDTPSDQHSIDRIDGTKGYFKDNCRWATRLEQGANLKNNALLTLNGQTFHQMEWVRRTGINLSTLRNRLRKGWSVENALTTPPRHKEQNG